MSPHARPSEAQDEDAEISDEGFETTEPRRDRLAIRRHIAASPRSPGSDQQSGSGNPTSSIYERILKLAHPSSYTEPYEAEQDLRDFLKVIKPDWSAYRPKGYCEIDRVMAKLKAIGVVDIWELMKRVELNVLNEDLFRQGSSCFSDDTVELIRAQRSFLCALENLREPYYRQVGLFAPVPQLLAKSNRFCNAIKVSSPKKARRGELDGVVSRPDSGARQVGNTRKERLGEVDSVARRAMPSSGARPLSLPKTKTRGSVDGLVSRLKPRPSTAPFSGNHSSSQHPSSSSWDARPRRVSSALAKSCSSSNTQEEQSSTQENDWEDWEPRTTSRQDLRFSRPGIPPRSCWSRPASSHSRRCQADAEELAENHSAADEGEEESCSSAPRARSFSVPAFRYSVSRPGAYRASVGQFMHIPEANRASRQDDLQALPEGNTLRRSSDATSDCQEDHPEMSEAELQDVIEKMQADGAAMVTQSRMAKWKCLTGNTLLDHGQAVLAEQQAMEDKHNLYHAMAREGAQSVTRRVISANIQCRLKEEAVRDAKTLLDVHHHCTSIRRNLNAMANARRDLNGVRLNAQRLLQEDQGKESLDHIEQLLQSSRSRTKDALAQEHRGRVQAWKAWVTEKWACNPKAVFAWCKPESPGATPLLQKPDGSFTGNSMEMDALLRESWKPIFRCTPKNQYVRTHRGSSKRTWGKNSFPA